MISSTASVLTDNGYTDIKDISVGDSLVDPISGAKVRVSFVGFRNVNLSDHPEMRPVELAAHSLSKTSPDKALYVSPQQRIYVCRDRVFSVVSAAALTGDVSLTSDVIGEFEYALLLTEQPSLIVCNGVALEVASLSELRAPRSTDKVERLQVVS